eukprot:CAMPEP_0198143356 /NCGR_PEP_ID=MMETSP1443-20131203/6679_1 /TAXON_ID=186043 /ORGANISM="Entomoneis sp., Strain CCMP2396" /LENGTH=274 /DNA_ID=CAMNT_0043806581 /DNA_START=57 /DNA_END=881 /DNA_ORIENTATION=+
MIRSCRNLAVRNGPSTSFLGPSAGSSGRRTATVLLLRSNAISQSPGISLPRRAPLTALARPSSQNSSLRAFSSNAAGDEGKKDSKSSSAADDADTKEIVLTPGEKVQAAGRLSFWLGIGAFASVCAYYIGKELFPTKMSPNRAFDRSYALIRKDAEVSSRYGEPLKAYGRDHGGHREGRRNFIEHTEYKNEEDGSNRTRVRYNLEGRFGTAFVFAEVSSEMPSGEFVYILVQDKANGRVNAVVDNRAGLTAQRLAGGNKEAQGAMAQLLGGGKK